MENATKALLIAGGILIAIVLITMGVYVYVGIHNAALAQDLLASQEQLAKFNKKYDAYNKELLHGTEVITLCNMAYEDSLKIKDQFSGEIATEDLEIKIYAHLDNTNAYIYQQQGEHKGERLIDGDYSDMIRVLDGKLVVDERAVRIFSKSIDPVEKAKMNDFKRRVFRCISEGFDPDTGLIYYMEFMEVPLQDYKHK